MAKIDWSRHKLVSKLDRDYFNDPKKGFDSKWHEKRNSKRQIKLGIHEKHNWQVVKLQSGPHTGKIICNDCGGKFVTWLPKGNI